MVLSIPLYTQSSAVDLKLSVRMTKIEPCIMAMTGSGQEALCMSEYLLLVK